MNERCEAPASDRELDVRGLSCPLPILKTRALLAGMQPDEKLWVQATDPHSVVDFMAYCEKTGTELARRWEDTDEEGRTVYHFLLVKGEGTS